MTSRQSGIPSEINEITLDFIDSGCTSLYSFDSVDQCIPDTSDVDMTEQIMTVKDVAKYLKVNERTIYRMATDGRIPAFRVGTSWRFKLCDIDEWIESERNSAVLPMYKKN